MTCEQLHQFSHEDLIEPKYYEKDSMNKGSLGHTYLESYYKSIKNGVKPATALKDALSISPHGLVCECGLKKESCTCETYRPAPSTLSKEVIDLIKDRIQIYVFANSTKDFQPEAIEVGFSNLLYEDSKYTFILEGRIDVLARFDSTPIVVDHKFQERRYDLYKKSIQFRNYTLVAERSLLMINYIRLTKGFESYTLERQLVGFNSIERAWWKDQVIQQYFRIAKQRERNEAPQKNFSSCSGRFNKVCPYTALCECMDNPGLIEITKAQFYKPKAKWRPW
jgi:hypothetical protein